MHPDDQTPTVLPPRSEWLLSGEMNKLAARDMGPSDHGASFKKTRGLTRFVVLTDHSLFFSMHFDEFSVFCSNTLDGIKTKEGDSLATEKALRAQFKKIDTDQTGSDAPPLPPTPSPSLPACLPSYLPTSLPPCLPPSLPPSLARARALSFSLYHTHIAVSLSPLSLRAPTRLTYFEMFTTTQQVNLTRRAQGMDA